MGKRFLALAVLCFTFFIGVFTAVSAEDMPEIKASTATNLFIAAQNRTGGRETAATCKISIYYPINNTAFVTNAAMSQVASEMLYYYSINTGVTGVYNAVAECSKTGANNGATAFQFRVVSEITNANVGTILTYTDGDGSGGIDADIGNPSTSLGSLLSHATYGLSALNVDLDAILSDTNAYDTDAEYAAAVWNALASGYGVSGSYGEALEVLKSSFDSNFSSVWTGTRAGYLDYLADGTYGLSALNVDLDAILSDSNLYDSDAEFAVAVWNALASGYGGVGTYGQALEDVLSDSNLYDSDAEFAAAVWNANVNDYGTASTYGSAVEDILVDTSTTLDDYVDSLESWIQNPGSYGYSNISAMINATMDRQVKRLVSVSGTALNSTGDAVSSGTAMSWVYNCGTSTSTCSSTALSSADSTSIASGTYSMQFVESLTPGAIYKVITQIDDGSAQVNTTTYINS